MTDRLPRAGAGILILVVLLGACDGRTIEGAVDAPPANMDMGVNPALDIPLVPEADELARACARLSTCGPLGKFAPLQSGNQVYLDRSATLTTMPITCLASATTGCAAVFDCLGTTFVEAGPCAGKVRPVCSEQGCLPGALGQCTGPDILELCFPTAGSKILVDCQKTVGAPCKTFSDSVPGCSLATPCSGPGKHCAGTIAAGCHEGNTILGTDCARSGLVCHEGDCVGPGEPCLSESDQCEGGDTIAICVNGYRLRVKCSDLGSGFSCTTTGSGARCRQGSLCDPATAEERCIGSQVELCTGKPVLVDCVKLGFTGCSNGRCVP